MGQNQSNNGQRNMLDNWKVNSLNTNIFTNMLTNEQVERHLVQLSKPQQQTLKKRMQEHHAAIVRVLYYHSAGGSAEDRQFYVYTDRMEPLNRSFWAPVNSALFVLKGFRRLSSMYSLMRVTPKMVGMNEKGEIKLWINQNPVVNQIGARADNEEQMLADIIRIVMNYDSNTAGLLVGCQNVNEALNKILLSLSEQRGQAQFSQRNKEEKIGRPTEKLFYPKEEKVHHVNQSDRFRARKTEEEWKNSSDPRKKVTQNPDFHLLHNVRVVGVPRYINVENAQQDNREEKLSQAQKKNSPYQRFPSETSVPNQAPRPENHQYGGYKQSTMQFNHTGPVKNMSNYAPLRNSNETKESGWNKNDDKFLKNHQQYGQKSQRVGNMISPKSVTTPPPYFNSSGEGPPSVSNRLDPEKKSPWKLFKKSDFQIQHGQRKSDLHQQFLHHQSEHGRVSDFPPFIQKRKKFVNKNPNQKPEIIEEVRKQENEDYGKINRHYKSGIKHIEANGDGLRTRTQDFTNTVINTQNQQSWNSNHSQSRNNPYTSKYSSNFNEKREASGNMEKKQLKASEFYKQYQKSKEDKSADILPSHKSPTSNSRPSKVYGTQSDRIKQYGTQSDRINQKRQRKLQKKLSEPSSALESLKKQKSLNEQQLQENIGEENSDEKKVVKKQLAKQLKMEFTSLLTPTEAKQFENSKTEQKSLLNTKSSKDILIKQKVEKKKATFAQLKSEAMKILKDDLL